MNNLPTATLSFGLAWIGEGPEWFCCHPFGFSNLETPIRWHEAFNHVWDVQRECAWSEMMAE